MIYHDANVNITLAGLLIALFVGFAIGSTIWWMLHPPASFVQKLAREATSELERMVGSIVVVFSADILSSHMMVLAAKLARGERSELLAIYVIEVPYTLPPDAQMPLEERAALDALGAAETIAGSAGISLRTEIIKARSTKQAVLDLAKRERANLIILGSFREGKYTGAPLGRTIEEIAADAKCDVLIGVEGKHGTILYEEPVPPSEPNS
ncbi:MAG TPA: universal stress protein [Candidatus Acidoferrales bacterium]|nr:universal stress protein [Candidatus Acidoferrales bacterium]